MAAGSAVSQAARAEPFATSGETCASADAWAFLRDSAGEGEGYGGGGGDGGTCTYAALEPARPSTTRLAEQIRAAE